MESFQIQSLNVYFMFMMRKPNLMIICRAVSDQLRDPLLISVIVSLEKEQNVHVHFALNSVL